MHVLGQVLNRPDDTRDLTLPPGPVAMALLPALFLALLAGAHAELPGCKIRVTSAALELGKAHCGRRGPGGALWLRVLELRVSVLP